MRKMSFSHVPHDQGARTTARPADPRGLAGPCGAARPDLLHGEACSAGAWRASVARPAVCWSQDTIPKPDGLAGPVPGPDRTESNATRTLCDSVQHPFEPGPAIVRGRLEGVQR